MKFSLYKLIFILIGFSYLSTALANTEKFLSVADIHFTPFASCAIATLKPCPIIKKLNEASAKDWESIFEQYDSKTPSAYHHDTNYALLKSMLQELQKTAQAQHPRFAVLLGDFLAHSYREQYILFSHDRSEKGFKSFVEKTLQFMTMEIRTALPESDIYPAVGNNDSYTGDYSVVERGDFLRDTSHTWAELIKDKKNQNDFRLAFPVGGYYAVALPSNRNLRVLVLDTVLFSAEAKGPNLKNAADAQLNWLHQQLVLTTKLHQHVLLAFHIPVGIDVYKTVRSPLGGIKEFWHAPYSAQFQRDLQEFTGTIVGVLPGHIHMEGFQLVGFTKPNEIPISFTPSISPIFGNNPAFKVYSYDATNFQLTNYETFFLPLNEANQKWEKESNLNS